MVNSPPRRNDLKGDFGNWNFRNHGTPGKEDRTRQPQKGEGGLLGRKVDAVDEPGKQPKGKRTSLGQYLKALFFLDNFK
jgi:hypothetical protein